MIPRDGQKKRRAGGEQRQMLLRHAGLAGKGQQIAADHRRVVKARIQRQAGELLVVVEAEARSNRLGGGGRPAQGRIGAERDQASARPQDPPQLPKSGHRVGEETENAGH